MTTLRCTSRALKRFKLVAEERPPRSTGRLGDWYVNLLNVGRDRLVLCLAEESLFPVILPARQADFPAKLPDQIEAMLIAIGVEAGAANREAAHSREVRIGRTENRSILGVMNDCKRMAEFQLGRDGVFGTAMIMADAPFNPLGFKSPAQRTLELFATKMSGPDGGR